jgi:hypothetical protein
VIIWLVAWHGAVNLWRIAGWAGVALAVLAVATFLVLRSRKPA